MSRRDRTTRTDALSRVSAMVVAVIAWVSPVNMACAQEAAPQVAEALGPVRLRVDPNELPKEESAALVALLSADLVDLGSELRMEYSTETESAWFDTTDREPALLLASLDLDATRWRVTLVDPVRRRAVARTLPGARRNGASFEAVASIILSAASSLAEGSEVGSAPIEDVVEQEAEEPSRQPEEEPPALHYDPVDPLPERVTARETWLHLDLGFAASTLAPERLATFGPELGVGLRRPNLFVDVRLRRELESRIATDFGDLPARRTRGFLSGGPLFKMGAWELLPWAAVGVEVFQRGQGDPRPGAIASPARSSTHFGVAAGIAAELPILGPLRLRGALEGALFPRRLEVTATATDQVLIAPWIVSGTGVLGLGVQL